MITAESTHIDVNLIKGNDELEIDGFIKWRPENKDLKFLTLENEKI